MNRSEIIVIGVNGVNGVDDYVTLEHVAEFFESRDPRIADALRRDYFASYDMSTKPRKGDAYYAIRLGVRLVVALHLFGIDQVYVSDAESQRWGKAYMYKGKNGLLLERCMTLKIPLVAWGDQPWLGVEKRTQIHDNNLWLYEPNEEVAHGD